MVMIIAIVTIVAIIMIIVIVTMIAFVTIIVIAAKITIVTIIADDEDNLYIIDVNPNSCPAEVSKL